MCSVPIFCAIQCLSKDIYRPLCNFLRNTMFTKRYLPTALQFSAQTMLIKRYLPTTLQFCAQTMKRFLPTAHKGYLLLVLVLLVPQFCQSALYTTRVRSHSGKNPLTRRLRVHFRCFLITRQRRFSCIRIVPVLANNKRSRHS